MKQKTMVNEKPGTPRAAPDLYLFSQQPVRLHTPARWEDVNYYRMRYALALVACVALALVVLVLALSHPIGRAKTAELPSGWPAHREVSH